MPRKLRIQYPGAMYHVVSRGDQRENKTTMMKRGMFWGVGGLIISASLLALFVMGVPNGPPSYWSFYRHRSQKYYAQFAKACDELIAKVAVGHNNEYLLAGVA